MKKVCFIAFLVFNQTIVFSQNLFQRFYNDKHMIKEKYEYIVNGSDTIKHGIYYYYFSNGNVYQQGQYKNNKMNDLWIVYYENGNIMAELNYVDEILSGEFRKYDNEGILVQSGVYLNGNIHGKLKMFDNKGDTTETAIFNNGILNGEYKKFRHAFFSELFILTV